MAYSLVTSGVASLTVNTSEVGMVVTSQIPPDLLVANTQLIWSSVTYTYQPITQLVIGGNIPLSDRCFTRPRQSDTVSYSAT